MSGEPSFSAGFAQSKLPRPSMGLEEKSCIDPPKHHPWPDRSKHIAHGWSGLARSAVLQTDLWCDEFRFFVCLHSNGYGLLSTTEWGNHHDVSDGKKRNMIPSNTPDVGVFSHERKKYKVMQCSYPMTTPARLGSQSRSGSPNEPAVLHGPEWLPKQLVLLSGGFVGVTHHTQQDRFLKCTKRCVFE